MKNLILIVLGLVALGAAIDLLWPRSEHLSDRQIRNRLAGVWRSDGNPPKVIENNADGTIAVRINGRPQVEGTWEVRNGYLITTPIATKADGHPALIESNKVLTVFQDMAILQSIDGHTPLTFHRQ